MACAFFLFGLGGYDLSAPDEPRYALVAQEMMRDGHWLLPHRNQRAYPDKPPLFFWSIAATSTILGGEIGPWSARLPSALAALAIFGLLFQWERETTGTDTPVSPLIAMASYRFLFQAHMAQIDMLLCLTTTIAGIEGYRHLTGATRRTALMGLAMGFGILAKGPVAWLIPVGACLLYRLMHRDARFPVHAMTWSLIPPLIWLAALGIQVWQQQQWHYFANLLFDQTLVRYVNPWHHHKPITYYLTTFLYDFFPWSLLLYAGIPASKQRWRQLAQHEKFSWLFIAFVFVFFSLSKGKRNLYLMPCFPFAAVVLPHILKQIGQSRLVRWVAGFTSAIWLLPAGLLLAIVIKNDLLPPQLSEPPHSLFVFAAVSWVCLVLLSIRWVSRHRWVPFLWSQVASSAVLVILLYGIVLPWVNPQRSAKAFMTQVNELVRDDPSPLAMVDFRAAYRFYGVRHVVELSTLATDRSEPKLLGLPDLFEFTQLNPESWVIIREPDLQDFESHCDLPDYDEVLRSYVGDSKQMILLRFHH
ncbi:MAG: glycosyltransferase family 39 protein [Acidobacteria bacterium]|nr:glycosyltransferase family 39 protein [Acidobacteriota bacterium]